MGLCMLDEIDTVFKAGGDYHLIIRVKDRFEMRLVGTLPSRII